MGIVCHSRQAGQLEQRHRNVRQGCECWNHKQHVGR